MFLGIDLGTSELKALLLDEQHRIIAQASAPLTLQQPQPLWSEQQPQAWWAALDAALLQLKAQQPQAMAAVQAIGLAGQMHGAVVLDAQGTVLRPAILWNDGRSGAQCAALEAAQPLTQEITGNLAMPGFTAPKLLWLREHEPRLFDRIRQVLLPKDWLRLRLTGEAVSEMSDASGTLWLDVAARRWSAPMLVACGLDASHMPRLVEGSDISGTLKAEWAQRWGLPSAVPVAGGGGDNAASAVGMGAVAPGQGFVSLGTSGVVFLCGARFSPNPARAVHAFCHALPGQWHQMSVMLSAASALQWAARLLGSAGVAEMLGKTQDLTPAQCAAAPIFLPYLNGERTPHNNPHATAMLQGLTSSHGPADVAHAVMEGVCFGLVDGWQALGDTRAGVQALSLVGGGARSARWAQWLAAALGVALTTHEGGEAGAALGAARLAWLSVGGSLADAAPMPPVSRVFEPAAGRAELLAWRHLRFQQLYAGAKGH